MSSEKHATQVPVAIVGMGCRLPGHSNSPSKLWEFLLQGGVASNTPPDTRFSLEGHYDGTARPRTMKTPGGMFMEDVDPAVFDAQFFNTSRVDAIAADPQQRQLLEVTYECLENAGIPLEQISGTRTGVIIGNSFIDYGGIQNRDPEDRADSITAGLSQSILSNRISHFFNINGPSMTVDTACSGSLVGLDVACHFLGSYQANAMIVGGANMWLSPEHNEEVGMMNMTMSKSGRCQSFDANADGYVKAEAINALYLKRLDDAIRDGDPIRAVIRGTASNASGRTQGIANPSSAAQAMVTKRAYENAGITDFHETFFVECHGTGTLAGDPVEVSGVASVFGPGRLPGQELIIGSIKSNVGHAEAAAGINGLIKATFAVERGLIPGNPTFITPSPRIDWAKLNVKASRANVPWTAPFRRASVNSFGFGGANAHVVIENATQSSHVSSYKAISSNFFDDDDEDEGIDTSGDATEPKLLVFSANEPSSLQNYTQALNRHLLNPSVSINVDDLAYTLSERRSKLYHRGFSLSRTRVTSITNVITDKQMSSSPRVGFVFTGQGAQWAKMGAELLRSFPIARRTIDDLDKVLQSLAKPPKWLLSEELTLERSSEALRQPEFSQPLVTALQLALFDVLADWNVRPCAVVGHSSGEIAAAAAAGYMTYADAIKTAFYRGQAAKTLGAPPQPVGMLAIGVGPSEVEKYLVPEDNVQIACYNSPSSLTLSGTVEALERTRDRLQADKHFARLLLVDLAYHSDYMSEIGKVYEQVLLDDGLCQPRTRDQSLQHPVMFSSVHGRAFKSDEFPDAAYWKKNMVSPVKFTHAASALLRDTEAGANFLIEVGPSNALAGPLAQIKKDLASKGAVDFIYNSALTRGQDSTIALYKTAGHLFLAGAPIDLTRVNRIDKQHAKVIVDLPNYSWNHTNRYWHETRASKDWRFKRFVNHDLLGSKIGGTSWDAPIFKKVLKVADVPWLRDHCLGTDIVFPGAAYVAMAVEAVHQTALSAHWNFKAPPKYRFRLRDVQITRALVLDEKKETRLTLSLGAAKKQSNRVWFTWAVRSVQDGTTDEVHATGLVGFETDYQDKIAAPEAVRPLENPASSQIWYKSLANMGYNFGPSFQHHVAVEGNIGQRNTRSSIKLEPPPSNPLGQSRYPIHPAVIDACFQATSPALWKCELPPSGSKVLVPKIIGDIIVEAGETDLPEEGIALASATYLGIGNPGQSRNYQTHVSLYNPKSGKLLVEVRGLVPGEIEVEDSKPDLPLITKLVWRPDIGLALNSLKGPAATTWASKQSVQNVLDLIAHKEPRLTLLEVNLTSSFQSAWSLDGPSSAIRAAASQFEVAVVDPKVMLAAQEKLPGVEVQLVNASTLDLGRPSASYDLLVLLSGSEVEASSHQQIQDLFDLVKPGGFIVSQGLDPVLIEAYGKSLYTEDHYALTQRPIEGKASGSRPSIQHLSLLSDKAQCHPEVHQTIDALTKEGWNVKTVADPATLNVTSEDLYLVLDELHSNVLDTVDSKQWDVIQSLVNSRAKLLWVTAGGQNIVHSPNRAAIAGLFRSIRNEEQVRFSTLDVRSSFDEHTVAAISACLDQLASDDHSTVLPDSDFVQQGAEVLISRIVPDDHLSVLQDDKPDQQPVETVDLQGFEGIVQLGCERLGSLDSIQFSEVTSAKALDQGTVEVKIHAAGLNYKDVVVTMGHVPGDETQLGYEAAGIVTQVASDVEGLVPGDRVVVWGKGCFANRIRTTPARVHKIPDHLTFQDAATMPIVYVTSIHSLFDQAALSSGKTVLIHSAAGGIGIASIQLAKYCGAEIFVTVGSQEKRDYLRTTFGLGDDHIFSSRNADFSEQILNYTGGRGVDVVLNSLTGEMLEESFRVLADGGIMVEIGKKDIIDRATLTMTPFDRNISFRAVDLSAERAPDVLVARNLKRLFELFEQGHIAPIKPIKQFSWSDVPSAIRYMRNGQHMGKIILYDGENTNVQVPIRRAVPEFALRPDRSYLIVGGLRGLCGSLAVYLAKKGAKHVAVIARSGYNDTKSQRIIAQINALGASVDLLQADVTKYDEVACAFKKLSAPLAGIIQGAMVLRDRPFSQMSVSEYHQAAACKIQGTWNLHHAAEFIGARLEFFTMLSSLAGIIGNRGQANYAAANAFLDSFATYRRSLGLVACSIDLGVMEDNGVMSESEKLQNLFDPRVFPGINEATLCKILRASILQADARHGGKETFNQHILTGLARPQPADSQLNQDVRFFPLFCGDGSRASDDAGGEKKDAELQLAQLLLKDAAADAKARHDGVNAAANAAFTRILQLPEAMDVERPLDVYGIDSLAAVELRNWIRTNLGALVTTLDILNAASLSGLSEKIIEKAVDSKA